MRAAFLASILMTISAGAYDARSQDSVATTNAAHGGLNIRLLLSRGFFAYSGDGADQSGFEYTLAIGSKPDHWLYPSIHLYLTYERYHYLRGWITSTKKDYDLIGVYPTVRLFGSFIAGYGISYGKRYVDQWSLYDYPNPAHTVTDERSAKWSPLFGFDFNLYVTHNFYFAFGILLKEPVNFYTLGIARTF